MADVLVRLSINENSDSKAIGSIVINNPNATNNISLESNTSGELEINHNNTFSGSEVISFGKEGVLYFNSSGYLANSKNDIAGNLQDADNPRAYYFGVTNKSGEYDITFTITKDTDSVDLDSIVIIGDSVAGQYPIEAYIDDSDTPITNDNSTWNIFFNSSQETHTIRFTKWNRVNYNAILLHIRVMFKYIDIINNLNDLSSIAQITPDASVINYGVIANTGNINVTDPNGKIRQLIRDGILSKSNIPIDVVVNGTIIQKHISEDSDYNTTDNTFSVYLTNIANGLDILKYKGLPYPEREMSLYEVLSDVMVSLLGGSYSDNYLNIMLKNKCVYKYNGINIESNIKDYLQYIKIKYPAIEYGKTYREILNEICTIAQLNLIINKENQYEFISARPLLLTDDKPFRITRNFIMNDIKTDVIIRNKYDGVEISETVVNDTIEYDSIVYSPPTIVDGFPYINPTVDNDMLENMSNSENYKVDKNKPPLGINIKIYYIFEKNYYYDGEIIIPKKSNNNLNKILSIDDKIIIKNSDGTNTFRYNLKYNKLIFNNQKIEFNSDLKPINIKGTYAPDEEYNDIVGVFDTYYTDKDNFIFIDLKNNSKITILEETEQYYKISYHILVGQEKALQISGSAEFIKIIPTQLEFSIYGNKRVITFEQISANTDNIEKARTKCSITTTGNLLQTTTYFNDENKTKMSSIIKDNILSDYKDGISTMTMQIACGNLLTKDGLDKKEFNKGDLIDINNTIFLTGDKYEDGKDRNWRVFSREFSYDGEPLINLVSNELKDMGLNT